MTDFKVGVSLTWQIADQFWSRAISIVLVGEHEISHLKFFWLHSAAMKINLLTSFPVKRFLFFKAGNQRTLYATFPVLSDLVNSHCDAVNLGWRLQLTTWRLLGKSRWLLHSSITVWRVNDSFEIQNVLLILLLFFAFFLYLLFYHRVWLLFNTRILL